jgi:hypothetical protein
MFALTVNFEGGADADVLVRNQPLTCAVPQCILDAVIVASFAAYRHLALSSGSEHHRTAAAATLD